MLSKLLGKGFISDAASHDSFQSFVGRRLFVRNNELDVLFVYVSFVYVSFGFSIDVLLVYTLFFSVYSLII